jgi:hypothetical protein
VLSPDAESGGGDNPQPQPTLVLAATNRDTVSHDAAVGILALSSTTSIPLSASASVADGHSSRVAGVSLLSAWPGRVLGYVLGSFHAERATSASVRERTLAVLPPQTASCMISGTTTTTVDDRDGNGMLSVGDVGTVVFTDCQDTADETINGTSSLAFTQVGATSLSARLTLTALSDVTTNHSLTLDGSMLFDLSTPSASVTNIKTTADGSVQVRIATHLPYSDTVTLESGFVVEENVDISIAPPVGAVGTAPGRTITMVSGRMQSAAANGSFDVSTLASAPITKYSAEQYPRSGVLQVTGKTGRLALTVMSASSVTLDLDANDDGISESSELKTWDWLL